MAILSQPQCELIYPDLLTVPIVSQSQTSAHIQISLNVLIVVQPSWPVCQVIYFPCDPSMMVCPLRGLSQLTCPQILTRKLAPLMMRKALLICLGDAIPWHGGGRIHMQAGQPLGISSGWVNFIELISPGTKWLLFHRRYFQMHFVNEKFCISIEISLKFVPKGPIDNNRALV